jgi:CHAT domain-containing protein
VAQRGLGLFVSLLLLAGPVATAGASSVSAVRCSSSVVKHHEQGATNQGPGTKVQGPTDVRELALGVPIERELAGGEMHVYRLTLASGQYLHVVVDQRGIDVVVTLFGPDGQQLAEVDGPTGKQGPEPVKLVTEALGEYRLEVSALEKDAALGRYEAKIEELREAAPQDRSRIAAERTYAEGQRLLYQETVESGRQAIEKYEQALLLWQALGDRFMEAQTLHTIGYAYYIALDENKKALNYYFQALLLLRALGDRPREEARVLNYIGGAYSGLQEPQKALDYYGQALQHFRTVGDRRGEARTLNYIGEEYQWLGEYQKMLEYYGQALSSSRAAGMRLWQARILRNIGNVYEFLGEYQKALDSFGQALTIARSEGHRYGEAEILAGIGVTCAKMDELQKAVDYFGQALALYQIEGSRWMQGCTLHNLGLTYDVLGEKQKALEYYGQALALWQAIEDREWEATTLSSIGSVHASLGEHQKALEHYNQALHLSRKIGLRAEEAASRSGIARMERDRGNLVEARAQMEAALTIIESLRTKVASQDLRASYLASKQDYYQFYIDLLMQQDEREPSKGHDVAALHASERARARSLLELLAEARIDIKQGVDPQLKQREQATQTRISRIQNQLIQAHSQTSPDKTKIAAFEEELKKVESDREQLEVEIRQKHPRYADLQYPTPLGLKEIQALLNDQMALLEYSLGQDGSFLFVVTKADFQVARLPSAAAISDHVRALRDTIATTPRRTAYLNYLTHARWLYQALIQPASKLLAGKRQVIIAPDGILYYLPFEVLLQSGGMKLRRMPWNRLSYLVRDYAISYIPSASVLAGLRRPLEKPPTLLGCISGRGFGPTMRHHERPLQPQKMFLACADPVYGTTELEETNPVRSALRSAFGESQPWKLARLGQSRREVTRIAHLYPNDEVALLLGEHAREENVKANGQLNQYRFVHFAAHGLLNETKPQYSGIVLSLPQQEDPRPKTQDPRLINTATQVTFPHEQQTKDQGPGTKDTVEDGLLQVYEIFNLKLNADLVVLSACETGLGKEVKGEGLIGLTRAFLYAGTPSVVVSLWQVQDRSTAELMVRFYRHLKNGQPSKAEALRQAQLELIRHGTFAHPYYWAPFVLVGQS